MPCVPLEGEFDLKYADMPWGSVLWTQFISELRTDGGNNDIETNNIAVRFAILRIVLKYKMVS